MSRVILLIDTYMWTMPINAYVHILNFGEVVWITNLHTICTGTGRGRDPLGCPMPNQPDGDQGNLDETLEDLADRPRGRDLGRLVPRGRDFRRLGWGGREAETLEDLTGRPRGRDLRRLDQEVETFRRLN